jgi:hypothetical protein
MPSNLKRNKFSLALIRAIEFSSIPIDIFWLIISRTTLGSTSFILAGIGALLSFCFGVGTFIYKYVTQSNKEKQENEELALKKDPTVIKHNLTDSQNNSTGASEKINSVSKNDSITTGISISILLATTIYWGITDVLVTLDLLPLASSIISPIALIIAGALAICAGIYLGIQHYEDKKNKQFIKDQILNLKNEKIIADKVDALVVKQNAKLDKVKNSNLSEDQAKDSTIVSPKPKTSPSTLFIRHKRSLSTPVPKKYQHYKLG